MEKPFKGTLSIPGTVINSQNAQLLVSSGMHALDSILGGGLPVGTLTIIEEDMHGCYAKVMLDHFLAEGIASNQSTFVSSLDMSPFEIVKGLPSPVLNDSEEVPSYKPDLAKDKMKIAFRYQNLPSSENVRDSYDIGHYFDLSKPLSASTIENSDICYWNGQIIKCNSTKFHNSEYSELLKAINGKIKEGKFSLTDNPSKRTILRIGIHSLGSPMWLSSTDQHMNENHDLNMFMYYLRSLMRSAFAVAVVTIPTHLHQKDSIGRCINSSDIAMRLQSFSGTPLENNQSLSDYQAFFYLTKLAPINSFASKYPESAEYGFKLRRKKITIEKLHLPPDVQEANDKKNPNQLLGCTSDSTNLNF